MITFEEFCRINKMTEEGLEPSQIARQLDLDSRTVSKWIRIKNFRPKAVSHRASKLDPFKDNIVGMLERYPYTATQIFQTIREDGFDGGYTIVKEYVRKVRPRRGKAFLKLTFEPGECAQVDWGSYGSVKVGSTSRRLSFFVMTMCHSRMSYVEFTVSQTMEHFLACHQNSFHFFGGIPEKIMVDNLKSAVLKRILGEEPCFNPDYLAFAVTIQRIVENPRKTVCCNYSAVPHIRSLTLTWTSGTLKRTSATRDGPIVQRWGAAE